MEKMCGADLRVNNYVHNTTAHTKQPCIIAAMWGLCLCLHIQSTDSNRASVYGAIF